MVKNCQIFSWIWYLLIKRRSSRLVWTLAIAFILYLCAWGIISLPASKDRPAPDSPTNEDILTLAAVERIAAVYQAHNASMNGYLVWSKHCQMPNTDPYDPAVMRFFKRKQYLNCSEQPPLTSVDWNKWQEHFVLNLHHERLAEYERLWRKASMLSHSDTNEMDYYCCYQAVERNSKGVRPDFDIQLSACQTFRQPSTALPLELESILVFCYFKNSSIGQTITPDEPFYANGHPLLPMRPELRERLANWQSSQPVERSAGEGEPSKPLSVLMIGIDSISRTNLIRAMPRTALHLHDNGWFEMNGYNKIGDNTFPNLMAVLAGVNETSRHRICPYTLNCAVDSFDFIWKKYRAHGYVTAFAEDDTSINTFNYLREGFLQTPVDYYLRPFLLAAEEKLPSTGQDSLADCIGPQHASEMVYDYALQIAERHQNEPVFGLFWANSFSHDYLSHSTAYDGRMVAYLQRLESLGVLERAFVVFFSDHGLRFGPTRKLASTHYEERLPFLFFWMPPHMRLKYPQYVQALQWNRDRLINPYDLHMTLRHLLAIQTRPDNQTLAPMSDCPHCQSLLLPVPLNRSCDEIGIGDHWCTCLPFQVLYKNSKTVRRVATLTLKKMNHFVSNYNNGSLAKICRPLRLVRVQHAFRSKYAIMPAVHTFRIQFITSPNHAMFEATVRYNSSNNSVQVTGEITKINSNQIRDKLPVVLVTSSKCFVYDGCTISTDSTTPDSSESA